MNALPFATLLVDPQTALLAGTIIPLVGIKLIRLQPELEGARAVRIGAMWGVMYTLGVSYMYFVHTDWMLGYLVEKEKVPLIPLWFIFLAANALCGAAGAAVSTHCIKNGSAALAVLSVLGAVAALGVVWIPHWDSYSHIGTYAEWKAGIAAPMPGPPSAALGLNIGGAITAVVSIALIVHTLRRAARA
jgi:hypothetical protein